MEQVSYDPRHETPLKPIDIQHKGGPSNPTYPEEIAGYLVTYKTVAVVGIGFAPKKSAPAI